MLNTEHVWRHDRLAIGVWDLRSFRRPLKTAHNFSAATTGPTDRFLLVKPVDVTDALKRSGAFALGRYHRRAIDRSDECQQRVVFSESQYTDGLMGIPDIQANPDLSAVDCSRSNRRGYRSSRAAPERFTHFVAELTRCARRIARLKARTIY